jgi:phosphatidylglycerophosphatase A
MQSKCTLATMYGVGLIKWAPGTAGSLVAALLAYPLLMQMDGWRWLLLGAALLTILGTLSADRYMKAHHTHHDPSEIVVDEWAGQWLTYAIFPTYSVWLGETNPSAMMLATDMQVLTHLVAGFLLFRLFDILKPWPISLVDRKVKGGFGVMVDDLVAALPAACALFAVDSYMLIATHGFA